MEVEGEVTIWEEGLRKRQTLEKIRHTHRHLFCVDMCMTRKGKTKRKKGKKRVSQAGKQRSRESDI